LRDNTAEALRGLPSVAKVLEEASRLGLLDEFGKPATTEAVRSTLAEARDAIAAGADQTLAAADFAQQAQARLQVSQKTSLRAVFNLTGTVLHTNLGRAVLAEAAIDAAVSAMREAVALEFDLASGRRGERDDHVRALLCELTGAEDATIVNNNAAAVLLALNSFAAGREAIVSRGELIEIGGAFRMPDIMARAGCKLVEVGTTNRTHARDYRAALTPQTGVILKVHPSNYRIDGFVAEVGAGELATIAGNAGVPLLHDLGSGTLVDLSAYGLKREPTVRDAVAEGAGAVTFSGDKLLGGPQAGFIVGRRELIKAINANPMKRALRVDKIRLAAIEATLKLYRDPDRLAERLPTLRALARPKAEIAAVAGRLRAPLAAALTSAYAVEVCDCLSQVGSGALPLDSIPSAGLSLRPVRGGGEALDRLAAALRTLSRPVIGRIADGALVLDLRCLVDEAAFAAGLAELSAP
jgi:L-seryl-tRNA(Ser) seleniumtransferase